MKYQHLSQSCVGDSLLIKIFNTSYVSFMWILMFPSLSLLSTGCIQSPSSLDMNEEVSMSINSPTSPRVPDVDEEITSVMRPDLDNNEDLQTDSSTPIETQHEESDSTNSSDLASPELNQICSPKALIWTNKWSFAHKLRAWVLENQDQSCSLESTSLDRPTHHNLRANNPFGQAGEEQCDDEGCWLTLPSFAKQWKEEANPDQGFLGSGALWTGVVDARLNTESQVLEAVIVGAHSGSTAVKEIKRRWDRNGKLLFEDFRFNHRLWFETRYEWAEGRLEKVEFLDFINSTFGFDISFSYDNDGRLTESKLLHKSANGTGYLFGYSNRWEYMENDAPKSLTRFSLEAGESPQPWLNMRWFYDENGHVSSRKAWINQEEMMMYRYPGNIDSYGSRASRNQFDWSRMSLAWDEGEGCVRLPTGHEYGYPDHQDHYNLGWQMNLRPDGIDEAHGYQRVYRVGMLGWFGHFGAQGDEYESIQFTYALQFYRELDQEQSNQTIEINSLYDEDRPLSEWSRLIEGSLSDLLADPASDLSLFASTAPTMDDFLNFSEFPNNGYRQWEWQGHQLLKDSLHLSNENIRTLEWIYDQQGQMIERTLKFNENLVARHQWSYHPLADTLPEACKITQYSIGHNLGNMLGVQSDFVDQGEWHIPEGHRFAEDEASFESFYLYTSTVEISDDGQCRSIQLSGGHQDRMTQNSLHFDTQGRLTQQTGRFTLNAFDFDFIRITYDEELPVITKLEHLDQDGQVSRIAEEYEFDHQGRLNARFTSISEGNRQEYTYICE